MFTKTPETEITSRWEKYRKLLAQYLPQAQGAFIFSRLNIFYFTGTLVNGVLWLPVQGDPILFCRRGFERAELETPLKNIVPFGSYRDIESTLSDFGVKLPDTVAAEMNGLPWSLSKSLVKYLPNINFVPGDKLIAMTRALKSDWELEILREAGRRHNKCITELLPSCLYEGMSELEIAHKVSELFYSEGHLGMLRMDTFGEEIFFGQIAIGESGNYPSVFNGPNGLRGVHPAVPYMGSEDIHWKPGTPLLVDNGFTLAGYQTDKTQCYWLGGRETIPDTVQIAYNFCVDIQNRTAEQLRPGAIPSVLYSQALELVANSPWSDGFMGLGKNKVGFLGHGIGLAIDEYPVLAKGFDLPLEEGMTIAVEPKIGLPGVGMIGIENTFEVTGDGGKPLTGKKSELIVV